MRLIDADALIALIEKRLINTAIIGWLCRIISEVPTIEVEPVRHGRWEEYPDWAHLRCTNCKIEFVKRKMPDTRKRCPNCGAKMRGGADE